MMLLCQETFPALLAAAPPPRPRPSRPRSDS